MMTWTWFLGGGDDFAGCVGGISYMNSFPRCFHWREGLPHWYSDARLGVGRLPSLSGSSSVTAIRAAG
jgi:hypothetical protein